MARLIFAMIQSLDGYVSGPEGGPGLPMPDDTLSEHFNTELGRITGSLYGRRMYEIMRYWDDDQPEEASPVTDFGKVWRSKPKWVVSRTLKQLGPNATLIADDLETAVRTLKATHDGDIEVAGPELAAGLGALGLIDEYQLYLRPVVLGGGTPFFATARPPLKLVESEQISDTLRLTYVPA